MSILVPRLDQLIGMCCYVTSTPPIPGVIRAALDDFIVREVNSAGLVVNEHFIESHPKDVPGLFSLFLLEKRGFSHYKAMSWVSKKLGIHPSLLAFSGIKDSLAHTWQLITVKGIRKEWAGLDLREEFRDGRLLRLTYVSTYPWRLYPGSHMGNFFEVVIRKVSPTSAYDLISKVIQELRDRGGVPGFYGYQRFGSIRPNNHIIGKLILLGDYKAAVEEFLARAYPYESDRAKEARTYLRETWDVKGALKLFPRHLVHERRILKYLVKHPKAYDRCFKVLPPWLRGMFMQAYQSYLFNKLLSMKLLQGFALKEVLGGEAIKLGSNETVIPVNQHNRSWAQGLVDCGRGVICHRLIGYDYEHHDTPVGEMEHELLEEESLNPSCFLIKDKLFPRLRCGWREIAYNPPRIKILGPYEDELFEGHLKFKLCFFLKRGFYATSLLREILKPHDPIRSGF